MIQALPEELASVSGLIAVLQRTNKRLYGHNHIHTRRHIRRQRIITMPVKPILFLLAAVFAVSGCDSPNPSGVADKAALIVRTMPAEIAVAPSLTLSGTIRAARENPLSFQVGGRINQRLAKAGDAVKEGDPIFTIDTRDLSQMLASTKAEVAAASSALDTAQDELSRNERLFKSKFISEQALDRIAHQVQETKTRLDAAKSREQQAEYALGYATLRAPGTGIVIDTQAEVGQVVAPGQPVAQFAHEGPTEIEVFLPQGLRAPKSGVINNNGKNWLASLREVAGSADAASRTVRARYTVTGENIDLPLGAVARLTLTTGQPGQNIVRVPIGAIDERGQGARVWVVSQGKASPVPVQVLSLSGETAQIQTSLEPGTPVIAMGTHLLQPNMDVQVYQR